VPFNVRVGILTLTLFHACVAGIWFYLSCVRAIVSVKLTSS
jgi:hypothetical protein